MEGLIRREVRSTRDVELSVSTDWQRIFPAKAFSLTYKAHEPMN
jgi:hypothetical protein